MQHRDIDMSRVMFDLMQKSNDAVIHSKYGVTLLKLDLNTLLPQTKVNDNVSCMINVCATLSLI